MFKLYILLLSLLVTLAPNVLAVPVSYELLPCSVVETVEAQRKLVCKPASPVHADTAVAAVPRQQMLVREWLLEPQTSSLHPLFLVGISTLLVALIARLARTAK